MGAGAFSRARQSRNDAYAYRNGLQAGARCQKGAIMIAQLIALPAQLCVMSVFVGLALWLVFWAFNNHRD
jgi:hypothetical protein